MYKDKDPRADLFAASAKPLATGLIAEQQLALFYGTEPQAQGEGWKTWYHRGHNFVLAYSEAEPGAAFPREAQPDEYVVYLPDAAKGATSRSDAQTAAEASSSIISAVPNDASALLTEPAR